MRSSAKLRERLGSLEQVTQEINTFLRGWAGYFRYGNSARRFDAITSYAFNRPALFVGKRRQRGGDYGRWLIQQHDRVRLIGLDGTVIAPRPNRARRGSAECRR
jgi:RNA-directed DNA polymerase